MAQSVHPAGHDMGFDGRKTLRERFHLVVETCEHQSVPEDPTRYVGRQWDALSTASRGANGTPIRRPASS